MFKKDNQRSNPIWIVEWSVNTLDLHSWGLHTVALNTALWSCNLSKHDTRHIAAIQDMSYRSSHSNICKSSRIFAEVKREQCLHRRRNEKASKLEFIHDHVHRAALPTFNFNVALRQSHQRNIARLIKVPSEVGLANASLAGDFVTPLWKYRVSYIQPKP